MGASMASAIPCPSAAETAVGLDWKSTPAAQSLYRKGGTNPYFPGEKDRTGGTLQATKRIWYENDGTENPAGCEAGQGARADHPIRIEPNPNRVVISVAGRVIADTREALTLLEAGYPAVQYVPRKDVDMALLKRTDHATYCPYKGDCAYFSIPLGGERSINAVWTYESPYAAVALIKDRLAFYPSRVDAIEEAAAF